VTLPLDGLGEVLLAEDNLPAARQTAVDALKIADEVAEKGSIAQAKLFLARVVLAENRVSEAETDALAALKAFRSEHIIELETWSNAVLIQSLLAGNKFAEAQQTITSAEISSRKSQDRAIRMYFAVGKGQVMAAHGKIREATESSE
jgi:hypothetical protein